MKKRKETKEEKEKKRKKKKRSDAAKKGWETRRKKKRKAKKDKVKPKARKVKPKARKVKPKAKVKKKKKVGPRPRLSQKIRVVEPERKIVFTHDDAVTSEATRKYIVAKLEKFSSDSGYGVNVTSSILADGTVAVGADFDETKEYDDLLSALSVEVESWGPGYKISVSVAFDPSKIVGKHEFTGVGEISVRDRSYDFYKGMVDVPTNFSTYIPGQFANMRFVMIPRLRQTMGAKPQKIRLIVLSGESVMGSTVKREVGRELDLFE